MKEYLSQKGFTYAERDVATDPEAMAELEKLGYLTTPVILIDHELVVGFNRRRLDELLAP